MALALIAALAGCGGGDAGDSNSYNTQAAWTSLSTEARTLNLSGNYQGVAMTMRLVYAAATSASVSLSADVTQAQTVTATATIAGEANTSSTAMWLDAQGRYLGSSSALPLEPTDECTLATSSQLPPTAASVGQSGTLSEGVIRAACTVGAAQIGTYTMKWSVEAIDGKTWFCTTSVNTVSSEVFTGKDCHVVTPEGSLGGGARFTLKTVAEGQTLELLFKGS